MPSKPSPPSHPTNSGITTDPLTGARHIPPSTRPDGSVRRELRVRPGFVPPEDVAVYRNRTAEAWRTRGSGAGVVPGAEPSGTGGGGGGEGKDAGGAAAGKNAKRREARRRAAAAAAAAEKGTDTETGKGADGTADEAGASTTTATTAAPSDPPPPPAADSQDEDADKEARRLLKKLRQARDLDTRRARGEAMLPEQVAKAIRVSELVRALDGLGFDGDGNKVSQRPPADGAGGPGGPG